jgi:hypothetical protein
MTDPLRRMLACVPTSLLVAAAVLFAACAGDGAGWATVIDRAPAVEEVAVRLSVEEAGFLASGALLEMLGADADPVPSHVDAGEDKLGTQTVWRLDMIVDVATDGERVEQRWRMWVGTAADGTPGVLRARHLDGWAARDLQHGAEVGADRRVGGGHGLELAGGEVELHGQRADVDELAVLGAEHVGPDEAVG